MLGLECEVAFLSFFAVDRIYGDIFLAIVFILCSGLTALKMHVNSFLSILLHYITWSVEHEDTFGLVIYCLSFNKI